MAVTILSLNAKGLNSPFKRSLLWKEARNNKADIVCVQETHFKQSSPVRLQHRNFPHIYMANSDKKRAGVLIAIRDSLTFQLHQVYRDPGGRFIILLCDIANVRYTIVNVYAPNTRQLSFLNRLRKKVNKVKQGRVIWGGDFNAIVDTSIDSTSRSIRPPVQLHTWLNSSDLYDVWRCRHASERDYTFYSNVHRTYSRIDMFLVDRSLLPQITNSTIGTITWSDHAPVTVSINLTGAVAPPFSWKNNTYVLSNPTHQTALAKQLVEFFSLNASPDISANTLWNSHKAYMRGVLIQLSSRLKRERTRIMSDLLKRIQTLELQQQSSPHISTHNDLFKARLELRTHFMGEYEYQLKRTKLTYYHSMNKPSKFMARRVAAARSKTKIPFLISQTRGHKITDPQDIADNFSEFYSKLYNLGSDSSVPNPSSKDMEDFLNSVNLPSLTHAQSQDLNAPITVEEITTIVKSLPRGKAPGPDGFSNEYYHAFIHTLAPHICAIFNHAMTTGDLPMEMLQATIVTLPKPGKSPDQPANFRPISLLNSDTKLYAKILASRILKVLPNLIDPDQVGFIKGRQAPDGTRRILNIISRLESTKTQALLLSLDAEKAFDRIHWGFAFQTLSKFGFRGPMLSAIRALYTCPSARVLASGVLSGPFTITNGTRQGCPLSPLLFAMVMEPLAESIRRNIQISGIDIAGTSHKLNLFADDIILTLTNIEKSLEQVSLTLDWFSNVSYYKVNSSKSLILDFAVPPFLRSKIQSDFPYVWQDHSIPYLGIHLTRQSSQLIAANFPLLIKNTQADLDRIAKVDNSWMGRIVIYKMIIFPKILYVLRALPISIPGRIFCLLHAQMNKFVWRNKKPRLSLSIMHKKLPFGGMGLPDLRAYHMAVTLDQIKHWWHDSRDKRWVTLETDLAGVANWKAVLLNPLAGTPCIRQMTPSIKITLQYWHSLARGRPPDSGTSQVPIPIDFVPLHIPDFPTHRWKDKGVLNMDHICDGSRLTTFAALQDKFDLPSSDHFRFTQLQHLLTPFPAVQVSLPSHIMPLLKTSYVPAIKGSHLFYELATGNDIFRKSHAMTKWEEDLGRQFSTLQWQNALKWAHRSSSCANHNEQYQKILTRWYFTPLRIARAYPMASPYCWRSCGSVGSLLHVFWHCTKLTRFWSQVFALITSVTGHSIPNTPEIALLLLNIETVPALYRTIVCNTLHAARLCIARHWKSAEPPSVREVQEVVSNVYLQERTLAWHRATSGTFQRKWALWQRQFPILPN